MNNKSFINELRVDQVNLLGVEAYAQPRCVSSYTEAKRIKRIYI